jgi:hypothetical protein
MREEAKEYLKDYPLNKFIIEYREEFTVSEVIDIITDQIMEECDCMEHWKFHAPNIRHLLRKLLKTYES